MRIKTVECLNLYADKNFVCLNLYGLGLLGAQIFVGIRTFRYLNLCANQNFMCLDLFANLDFWVCKCIWRSGLLDA